MDEKRDDIVMLIMDEKVRWDGGERERDEKKAHVMMRCGMN